MKQGQFEPGKSNYLSVISGSNTNKAAKAENETNLVTQTTCPVMGGAIDKKVYVEQDEKRIYVCCGGCIDPVKMDFGKYEAKLKKLGQSVEKTGGKD